MIRRCRCLPGCWRIFRVRNPAQSLYTRIESENRRNVEVSSKRRALIAVAAVIVLAAVVAAAYLHHMRRPLPPLTGASASAPPDLMSQLPPGAPVVAYIDVAALRKLQDSPLAAMLGLVGTDPKEDRDYQQFVAGTGFDYTRDLDTAAIAIWPVALLTPGGGLGTNQVLAVAEGRFDEEKIKSYALRTGHVSTFDGQPEYIVPGNPPDAIRFLSPDRIQLSTVETSKIPGPQPTAAQNDAMRARIKRVAGAPIFAAARTDTLPASFYDNFKNAPQLDTLVRSVKGLAFVGQPSGDRIDLALDAECDSLAHAAELATLIDTFRIFGSVALSDPKTRRQLTKEQAAFIAELSAKLKVTHQDHWVRMTLAVTPQMLGETNSTHAQVFPAPSF
jgi:hypothetical protein